MDFVVQFIPFLAGLHVLLAIIYVYAYGQMGGGGYIPNRPLARFVYKGQYYALWGMIFSIIAVGVAIFGGDNLGYAIAAFIFSIPMVLFTLLHAMS